MAWLDVTSMRTSSEERGLKQVRPSEVRVGEGAFWTGLEVNEELISFTWSWSDTVSEVPGPVGRWRGGECEVKSGEEVYEFR